MAPSSLALSAAERAELAKDPDAFARRAEQVLSSMVAKLHSLEAERTAEKVESEQRWNELERSHMRLRSAHERA